MTELVSLSTVGLILSTSICTVLCGQLILIFFNNMRYFSVKNCVNNDVLGSEIFHNIRKEWIEQVISKTKHPIFICSEHFDKNCYRNKDSKILRNGTVPSIFKMGCVKNSLQVARHTIHTKERI